jgi:oxygen-dependent protoporphyrinogen oxidase
MSTVGIIGGGITGLAAAHRLRRIAPALETTLIESETRLGGKIVTERAYGFVIEAGPDSFLTSKPRGIGLCEELGIARRLQPTRGETRRAYVVHAGALHRMPEGLTGLVPSRLEALVQSDLFTPEAKLRLQQEPEIPVRVSGEDETLAGFFSRRFGCEVYDRLVEPLMAGIYAGDGEELSLAATFPQLRAAEIEHGSVIRAFSAPQPTTPNAGTPAAFVAPISGMMRSLSLLPDSSPRRCSKRWRPTQPELSQISNMSPLLP